MQLLNQRYKGIYVTGIALASLFLILNGCREDRDIINVDNIDGSFDLIRYDRAIFDLDSTATDEQLSRLQQAYPAMWDIYFQHVLPLPPPSGEISQFDQVRQVLADTRLHAIADSVVLHYPDLTQIESELYRAFQYYRYYFPALTPPSIYTVVTDFSYFPFIFPETDSTDGVGVGLDMFLGARFPYTSFAGNHPTFSSYLVRTYNQDHLVKKTMDVIIDDLVGPPPGDRLLDLMIHNGKKLFILEHLMPAAPDSVIFEFTPEQLAWCEENERNLWAHYLTEDLLYSNEFRKINKLVNHSPNVPGMPAEAPGRVANWSGWRIIHEAARRNPELSMTDILVLRDAQGVLEMARYKPK